MNEELHPVDRQSADKKPGSFEDFQQFIHLENVDQKTSDLFRSFLRSLHSVSRQYWSPGACHACEDLETKARTLTKRPEYAGIQITPRSYLGEAHYWLEVAIGPAAVLIVDPFGVPTPGNDYMREMRTIVPFFGDPAYAAPYAQEVYSAGKELGSRGYHRFHP